MSRAGCGLCFETDLLWDVVNSLQIVHRRLASRHGDPFRALERKLAGCADLLTRETIGFADIGDGVVVMTPPPALVALVDEARALGVI